VDVTDPLVPVDVEDLTDTQLLERCRRARSLEESSEMGRSRAARGFLVDAKHTERGVEDPDLELVAFMDIFHPDRKDRPRTRNEARQWRGPSYRDRYEP
jgi:hypothetical protein